MYISSYNAKYNGTIYYTKKAIIYHPQFIIAMTPV